MDLFGTFDSNDSFLTYINQTNHQIMLAVEKVTDPAEFLNKSYQYLYENGIDNLIRT